MSLVEDIREVEVLEKEELRHTQVSGVGVIEDVPVKIVLGVKARWPVSTSPSLCLHLYQELLLYIYIIADSLFSSYQVRHVTTFLPDARMIIEICMVCSIIFQ